MKQFLAKLFITLFVSSIVTACSPPDDPAADAFDLVKAEILWNTINKSWSNNELRSLESGRAIYKINCAACHGKGGEGNLAIGAPSLINNAIIRGSIDNHIALIKNGRNQMPAFSQALSIDEISNVAIFERKAWGNNDYQVFNKDVK